MAISVCFQCPECSVSNEIPSHYSGRMVRCVGCNAFFPALVMPPCDIRFNCSFCDQSLETPPEMSGQLIDCPSCKNTIEVPVLGRGSRTDVNLRQQQFSARSLEETLATGDRSLAKQYAANQSASSTNHKQMVGLIGSAMLFIGVFCPIITIPIVGQMNYFQNGQGDGTIICVLAIASAALALGKQFRLLWLTGGGSLGLVAFTFVTFQSRLREAKHHMASGLDGNPFAGLAQLAVQSVQLQWGIAILVIGGILVLAAAVMPANRSM